MLRTDKYELLEEAWAYQDFVTKELSKIGISVNAYQSVYYQMKYGESASGIEIKNDRLMATTGNVYIEFKQTTLRGTENKDSGINCPDDSWLYVIGDYNKIYILSKLQLRSLLNKIKQNEEGWKSKYGISIKCHFNEKGQITSQGMVIPTTYLEETNLCIKKILTKQKALERIEK